MVQFAEKGQGHRVICLEAGSELVEQASLHLDQSILIAGQFLDQFTSGVEPTQISKVAPGLQSHAHRRARQGAHNEPLWTGDRTVDLSSCEFLSKLHHKFEHRRRC